MSKRAVLLVNLGSPDSPSVPDVRRYLREFLGDERVLDLPPTPPRPAPPRPAPPHPTHGALSP